MRWSEELQSLCDNEPPDESDIDDASHVSTLRSQLQKAIGREDYEYAAMLRDEIRRVIQDEQAKQ